MTSNTLIVALVCLMNFLTVDAQPARGNVGAWVYDHPDAFPPAQFHSIIKDFNDRSLGADINHVVMYGSDMEIYDTFCCSPPSAQIMGERIQLYKRSSSNTTITLIIDGRMDGEQEWAPNLARLAVPRVVDWSRWVAQWVCSLENVDGVQLDLEPIAGEWNENLRVMFKDLSQRLTSRDYGCISPSRPKGVALSTFAHAKDIDLDLMQSLGPQGYVVISGYDLGVGQAGQFITPTAYEANLKNVLRETKTKSAQPGGVPYMVGIPAAASTFEFESYRRNNVEINSGFSQLEYIQAATRAIESEVIDDPNYLGPMLWAFTYTNVYPPHSQNEMKPTSAHVNADVWDFLETNLRRSTPPQIIGGRRLRKKV